MIALTVMGERLEIDVFDDLHEDGHVELSRFLGDERPGRRGVESDAFRLDQVIRQHGKENYAG